MFNFDSEKDLNDFVMWAFGRPGVIFDETPKYWNKLHGDKLFLKEEDWMHETFPKMKQLWEKERNEARR